MIIENSLSSSFAELEDPRVDRTKKHELFDIIFMTVCAVICGVESWRGIEMFGELKESWLKKFIHLKEGIPSHQTIGRVFSLIDPKQFEECFLSWIGTVSISLDNEIIAIDGKTARRSYDKSKGKKPIHVVSAWAVNQGLAFGQVKVEDKTNEIKAIPELLDKLVIKGATITIDAAGCQKDIVNKIIKQKADYAIALKKNQPTLYEEVELKFNTSNLESLKGGNHFFETLDKAHGRITRREYFSLNIDKFIDEENKWTGLKSVGFVQSTTIENEKTKQDNRYYIMSFASDAKRFANAVRGHWHIENKLHWVLDVTFNEDHCRIRKDHAPQNFNILRKIVLNLLRQEKSVKTSIPLKRARAALNEKYLEKICKSLFI